MATVNIHFVNQAEKQMYAGKVQAAWASGEAEMSANMESALSGANYSLDSSVIKKGDAFLNIAVGSAECDFGDISSCITAFTTALNDVKAVAATAVETGEYGFNTTGYEIKEYAYSGPNFAGDEVGVKLINDWESLNAYKSLLETISQDYHRAVNMQLMNLPLETKDKLEDISANITANYNKVRELMGKCLSGDNSVCQSDLAGELISYDRGLLLRLR